MKRSFLTTWKCPNELLTAKKHCKARNNHVLLSHEASGREHRMQIKPVVSVGFEQLSPPRESRALKEAQCPRHLLQDVTFFFHRKKYFANSNEREIERTARDWKKVRKMEEIRKFKMAEGKVDKLTPAPHACCERNIFAVPNQLCGVAEKGCLKCVFQTWTTIEGPGSVQC